MWQARFATPRAGELHLRPFLLGSTVCDCDHPAVAALSLELVGRCTSVAEAAASVRAWVREHIVYTLQDKSDLASQTLAKREGMCTNKANLQVALLRAAGIPAGYSLVHVTKDAFAGPHTLPEVLELISPITLHVFCSVYIPAEEPEHLAVEAAVEAPGAAAAAEAGVAGAAAAAGAGHLAEVGEATEAAEAWPGERRPRPLGDFRCYDATERTGSAHLMEPEP